VKFERGAALPLLRSGLRLALFGAGRLGLSLLDFFGLNSFHFFDLRPFLESFSPHFATRVELKLEAFQLFFDILDLVRGRAVFLLLVKFDGLLGVFLRRFEQDREFLGDGFLVGRDGTTNKAYGVVIMCETPALDIDCKSKLFLEFDDIIRLDV
jgi:hypothetical protein